MSEYCFCEKHTQVKGRTIMLESYTGSLDILGPEDSDLHTITFSRKSSRIPAEALLSQRT